MVLVVGGVSAVEMGEAQYKEVSRKTIEILQSSPTGETVGMVRIRIPKGTVQKRVQENSRNSTTCSFLRPVAV